jgi:hypothetical protein
MAHHHLIADLYLHDLCNAKPCHAKPLPPKHFTKLCKSVYSWEPASEIQSIKETLATHTAATGDTWLESVFALN